MLTAIRKTFYTSLRKKKFYILLPECITDLRWRLKQWKRIVGLSFIQ
jgi:hypothetical protein